MNNKEDEEESDEELEDNIRLQDNKKKLGLADTLQRIINPIV